MSDLFDFTVNFQGNEIEVTGRFIRSGYTQQFHLNLLGEAIIIEYDEEKDFRVISPGGKTPDLDPKLIEELVMTFSKLRS